MKNFPCTLCQSEWISPSTPPTEATPTPTIERLRNIFSGKPTKPPTLRELFANFRKAVREWNDANRPVVSWLQLVGRYRTCKRCDFWNGWRCLHPKCGCTAVKLLLATEKCPIHKWEATV